MKLANGEMRPGKILEVLDNFGTIKASVPGLFSAEDQDKLPPIVPWPVGPANTFSTPKVGDEVWVLFFTDNPEELKWFRKDDFKNNNGTRNKKGSSQSTAGGNIQDQKNVEVITSVESGSGWASLYFSDGTGWMIKNQEAYAQIDQSGKITLSNSQPHGTLEISDGGIALGTAGGSPHPCPYGDKVAELLDKIINTFDVISQAAKGSPYTMAIATAIDSDVPKYKNDTQYINSDYVSLD